MLIEIDKSVLDEAQKGNQLAFNVLNDLAIAQRKEYHALWCERKVLDGIKKLPIEKLGDSIKIYDGVQKGITLRKKILEIVSTKAVVTFNGPTRRENNIIYIKPSSKESFSFYITSLLTENINDGEIFEYIAKWYLRKIDLEHPVFCKIDKQMGGGNPLSDVYKEYAENKKDRFCLCIADSDIKADVNKLLDNKLINESQKPTYGKTYKNVFEYDSKNNPFNCACYCFENVLEIENLIPFCIIENDNNYKHEVAAIKSANITDLSYYDFKKGLSISTIESSKPYIKAYWKKIIFKNQSIPTINGFGDKLLSFVLENHHEQLSQIDDNMLTPAQLKEYEEIGKRVCSWCCTMSVPRVML